MTDQVLNLLKFALLGLLYLFFARVLWAVWSEVRTPKQRPVQAGAGARHAAPVPSAAQRPRTDRRPHKGRGDRVGRLVILEPRSRRGMTFPMTGEITLGRDDHCTISINDDTFVSQLHLRFHDAHGQPMVEDLGSTNGTFHNGNRITGAKLLRPGDRVQVGTTVIEAQ